MMAAQAWVNQRFEGGQATDKKVGQKNAFAGSQSLDFRKSPSQISSLPRTRQEDGGVVTDLVQNEVMTQSGRMYAIGSSGRVYTRNTSGVWSVFGTVSTGTFGINYRQDQDAIYIAGTTTVSSITTISSAPALNNDFYGQSQSTYNNTTNAGFNVNSNQTGGTKTTAIATTYVEGNSLQVRYWQTDINPVVKIGIFIPRKGTGNWTMVVHDGLNNNLGTVTITNANLTANQWNYFTFTPINVNVGPNNAQTYHFHATSTVADGTVQSTTDNDLSTADMQLWANRLISTVNGLHPMETFQQFLVIGNGRYLSTYEPLGEAQPSNSSWQRQKLTFPPEYEVCGLTVFNEYLVIACERISTSSSNSPQEGIIFYWDGLSDTYNYFTKIPEGSPQAISEYENVVWYVAGGNWYAITSVAATPVKIRRLPGSENVYEGTNVITKVYPYMSAVRHGVHLLGWPSTTSNTTIPYGIYSYGRTDSTLPNSFGYSYLLSTGTQYNTGGNLTVGMVKNFGNVMHVSWRDGNTYGVDVVDGSSTPAAYASWQSLIFDDKMVTRDKLASYIETNWLTIQDGVSIVLSYSINRGDWVYSPSYSNSNLWVVDGVTNYARFDIGTSTQEERFNEIQVGIDIYCDSTVTLPPIISSVALIYDDLKKEALQ